MAYKSVQDQFAKQKADKEAAKAKLDTAKSEYDRRLQATRDSYNPFGTRPLNYASQQALRESYFSGKGKPSGMSDIDWVNQQAKVKGSAQTAYNDIGGTDPTKDPDAAGQRLFGLSENRLQEQYDDPVSKMLFEQLTNRISGKDQPYNEQTINALTTKNNEATAAGEMNRAQQIQESLASRGFSPSDPAYQAAMRQNQTQRQQQNQGALLDINSKANLANYDARTGAISQAGSLNAEQQNRLNQTTAGLANLYGQVSQGGTNVVPSGGGGGVSIPNYSQFMQALSSQGGGQPAAQPARTTASAPAQTSTPVQKPSPVMQTNRPTTGRADMSGFLNDYQKNVAQVQSQRAAGGTPYFTNKVY